MLDAAHEIPRRLNDPLRMFWWDLDVSLLVLAAGLAGMISEFFITGCVLGVLLASSYGRAKTGKQYPGADHEPRMSLAAPDNLDEHIHKMHG